MSTRLRALGAPAPGSTIALVGGVLGAALLTLSALVTWVLSRPAVRGEVPIVRALHDLAFLTGGPAHVVFLGLLVAGIAVPALLLGLLPRWLSVVGLVIAVLAELATVALFAESAVVLVPLARFPALLWLAVAGFAVRRRAGRRGADGPR
jgi:hypothetical protein